MTGPKEMPQIVKKNITILEVKNLENAADYLDFPQTICVQIFKNLKYVRLRGWKAIFFLFKQLLWKMQWLFLRDFWSMADQNELFHTIFVNFRTP